MLPRWISIILAISRTRTSIHATRSAGKAVLKDMSVPAVLGAPAVWMPRVVATASLSAGNGSVAPMPMDAVVVETAWNVMALATLALMVVAFLEVESCGRSYILLCPAVGWLQQVSC